MAKPLDTGSLLVMAVTLVLFVVALYTKGFSHDLLLEAGGLPGVREAHAHGL